ncbi:MAG: RNA pseudouridine synthase [Alistipes sp.]|nr:RNA pseudouridine synthase [Alistipes sp.]
MLHRFSHDISNIEQPKLFTWPFHYVPHPLAVIAAEEVQEYLATRTEWSAEIALGKMFGVLIVEVAGGEIGFLAAFSGNLAQSNNHEYFVPPIYDMLQPGDFFRRGEAEITAINQHIAELTRGEAYTSVKLNLEQTKADAEKQLSEFKRVVAERKAERDRRRAEGENSDILILESQRDNADMQRLKRLLKENIAKSQESFDKLNTKIAELKHERQQRSAALQNQIFEQFRILNGRGEIKDLCELFAPTAQGVPPAGAGECAAPKLLQYAFLKGYKPIAMAEFWQGASPRGEVRHHRAFYPACIGKCKPILMHMLEGLDVEPNPLEAIAPAEPHILFEDSDIIVIDKPCGMLSVEGKSGVRSVEQWAKERYPNIDSPMIVHRLDQSTSGILVLAKDKEIHKALQEQFIKHTISKRYTAIVEGIITPNEGKIELPMRLDYDNRPRQIVAEDGKSAITEYRVIAHENNLTRVEFTPITGRTHQLRLHSAHHRGLNAPIVGDNIYGRECNTDLKDGHRLCLHASRLEFTHPATGERITINSTPEF